MKCIYDNYGQCVRMVQDIWAPPPADTFSFWPFMAIFLCFCLCWSVAMTLFAPLIAREGTEGHVGKGLAVFIGLVGGIYGEHILIGLYYGVSGQALFKSAAFQTHHDILQVFAGVPGVFGVLKNIVNGG